MVFCNAYDSILADSDLLGHNPYFNRWFSAILNTKDFINGVNTSQSLF